LNWLVKLLLLLRCHSISVAPGKLVDKAVRAACGTAEAATITVLPPELPSSEEDLEQDTNTIVLSTDRKSKFFIRYFLAGLLINTAIGNSRNAVCNR
jgi:hypothetical protein